MEKLAEDRENLRLNRRYTNEWGEGETNWCYRGGKVGQAQTT